MSTIFKTLSFFIPLLLAFLIGHSKYLLPYLPQIIALSSLVIILLLIFTRRFFLPPVVFIVNLIVLSTNALNSNLFFLIYFLLFSLSFQNTPPQNLIYSLLTTIFYSYNLDSLSSLIKLFSLLLIAPLTYFIAQQQLLQKRTEAIISQDETDFLFWISLHLKKSLREIISLSDNSQITKIAKNLLKNSDKLERHIDESSDET